MVADALKEAALKAHEPRHSPSGDSLTGLVLSGGGTRGAYEVGIIAGLLEALGGSGHLSSCPFQLAA
ncbi:MAG TPA: hypothetical protein VG963_29345, partial [Polyangiaceae bacterium]|nr:hypothetical protein [Polyangiaceae bacterium]